MAEEVNTVMTSWHVVAMHEVFKRGLKNAYLLNIEILKIVSAYCGLILTLDSFCLLLGKNLIRVRRQRNLRISLAEAIFYLKS